MNFKYQQKIANFKNLKNMNECYLCYFYSAAYSKSCNDFYVKISMVKQAIIRHRSVMHCNCSYNAEDRVTFITVSVGMTVGAWENWCVLCTKCRYSTVCNEFLENFANFWNIGKICELLRVFQNKLTNSRIMI